MMLPKINSATYKKEEDGTFTVNTPTAKHRGFKTEDDAIIFCETFGFTDNRNN